MFRDKTAPTCNYKTHLVYTEKGFDKLWRACKKVLKAITQPATKHEETCWCLVETNLDCTNILPFKCMPFCAKCPICTDHTRSNNL